MKPIRCTFWVPALTDVAAGFDEDGEVDHWTTVYRNAETGKHSLPGGLPVGAIVDWTHQGGYRRERTGPDGRYLVCIVPASYRHFWHMDDRASNCGSRDDDEHRCWVRHGEPPDLTVDKEGLTCTAGAGSIVTDTWHGFLRGGYLVDC